MEDLPLYAAIVAILGISSIVFVAIGIAIGLATNPNFFCVPDYGITKDDLTEQGEKS